MEVLPEAYWQRCYAHFLRNALDYLPRKGGDDCLIELRWLYDRRDAGEARAGGLAASLAGKYPKLCAWVEENIEETFTFYRLPREHHNHLKGTNMLERINQELVRIGKGVVRCSAVIRVEAERTPWARALSPGQRPCRECFPRAALVL